KKISPLKEVSQEFFSNHKNPYIRMFQDLASSPGARALPKLSVWHEYALETSNASQRLWLLEATPEEALGSANRAIQKSWDAEQKRQRAEHSRFLLFLPRGLSALLPTGAVSAARREQQKRVRETGVEKPVRSNAS